MPRYLPFLLLIAAIPATRPSTQPAALNPVLNPNLPTLFIAGDSTAQPGNPNAVGWGKPFLAFFDPAKINLVNGARGGRSSRTFITDGSWDHILSRVKSHDFVLIQFGQNDGSKINDARAARGSLPGLGDETQDIDNLQTHQHETVHTFGFYMRQMIHAVKSKDATPILMTLTVRDLWKDNHVERGSGHYDDWTKQLAQSEGVALLDLTNLVADRYEQMGQDAVKGLFPRDFVHTGANGAEINAEYVVSELKALHENAILRALSPAGRAIDIAPPSSVLAPKLPVPRGAPREVFLRWLNLPTPADPALPDLFLIGDSTVRNGRGDGDDGQWGWGDALSVYFDPTKVNLVNRAVGGTGARTFITSGYWDSVLSMLKPGDYVVMQFGTNDNGARGALPGVGDDTQTQNTETVHSFGWYLRKYIADARAKGATPILCTLVPRNSWKDGKIARNPGTHADWARAVAKDQNVPLLDLYESIAQQYDQLGHAKTLPLFADGHVHTGRAGAELSAHCVLVQMHNVPGDPLAPFMRDKSAANW